jgi:hypothetical protein
MTDPIVSPLLDADRNLLFGLLALQIDLIDKHQLAEIWTVWAERGHQPLGELLVQRGILRFEDRNVVEAIVSRKLAKHRGDARAALAEMSKSPIRDAVSVLSSGNLERALANSESNGATGVSHADPYADRRQHSDEFDARWRDEENFEPRVPPLRAWLMSHRKLVRSTAAIVIAALLVAALAVLLLIPQDNLARRPQANDQPDPDRILERQMLPLVRTLFGTLLQRQEVVDHLHRDASLTKQEREAAIRVARAFEINPNDLNNASWYIVRTPGAHPSAYERALALAEEACRLEPNSGFYLNTLGVAQYRLGQYAKAVETLKLSDQINSASRNSSIPEDLAFLAMAYRRLGDKDKALSTFRRMTRMMDNRNRMAYGATGQQILEEQAFLAEATKVLGETKQ